MKIAETMKANIRTTPALLCALAFVALLCAGCLTSNTERLHQKVTVWVPKGSRVEDAKRTMEAHGFKCKLGHIESGVPWEGPVLLCRRKNVIINQIWDVKLFLEDDRVVGSYELTVRDVLRLFKDMH